MSPKGTQFASVAGLQAVLSPSAPKICCANPTHGAPAVGSNAPAIAGFSPEGRKKFTRAAETHGAPLGLKPQGAAPDPTLSGPAAAFEVGSVKATCQFFTSKSPRTVLALIGRFRCRPPLKLYARLKAKPPPKSCSKVKFACCEYA